VHVRQGFEFLGYKIKRGARPLKLPVNQRLKLTPFSVQF